MARRQDSGSSSSHENQRPTSHNEDALPELEDDVRGRADAEQEDEFEDAESEEMEEEEAEDEGNY
jgi:hypothetical protein